MRGDEWLQKILYFIIAVLSIYILYKGVSLVLVSPVMQEAVDSGSIQRTLEDAAAHTYAPGYTEAVAPKQESSWIAGWMRQVVPVFGYLADGQAEVQDGEKSDGTAEMKHTGTEAAETEVQNKAGTNQEEIQKKTGSTGTEVQSTEGSNAEEIQEETAEVKEAVAQVIPDALQEQLRDFDFLLGNYFTVDGGTTADAELLDADRLLSEDLSLEQNPEVPQILIYHTHSQETFADSREGVAEDSIVGMGEVLAELLRSTYGYNVIHDTGVYDLVDGVLDRSTAYDYARDAVQQILEEHPTIEVLIDLHRDGVEGHKFVTEIDGRPTSMIMFFNGISRNSANEPLSWLQNPYITQNLAMSLQLQLMAQQQYPGLTRNIYLKAERFNLHLRPRSLLIEAGTQLNTVEEEKNAMIPIADLLHQVLSGKYQSVPMDKS